MHWRYVNCIVCVRYVNLGIRTLRHTDQEIERQSHDGYVVSLLEVPNLLSTIELPYTNLYIILYDASLCVRNDISFTLYSLVVDNQYQVEQRLLLF